MDRYDNITPLDSRYRDDEVAEYLSDRAFLRYKCDAEAQLARTLAEFGICSKRVAEEIAVACEDVARNPQEVDEEEAKTRHDIRALVNCIQRRVSDEAKPFVHLAATSYDIVDTANSARFNQVVYNLLCPRLRSLTETLEQKAEQFADTVQVGRTHGQHAVPITFGFALRGFSERLSICLGHLQDLSMDLPGKLAGPVGAYNASSMLFDNPISAENYYLTKMGLRSSRPATQVVQPEPRIRLMLEICLAGGIMADLADDMRHLQRSEIGEVGEEYAATQVGSSTMPQKRNPINFENTKSMWKLLITRFQVLLFDQLCEHQRDLTNSASSRAYGEIIAYACKMAKTMDKTMKRITVDEANLARNLDASRGMVLAEPLYILLALHGHPDAHEAVRKLTQSAIASGQTFSEALAADQDLQPYLAKLSEEQRKVLEDARNYIGLAAQLARQ